jgi:hypothetical protein
MSRMTVPRDPLPDLEEARQAIRDPALPHWCHIDAAYVITSSPDSEHGDLLACLDCPGLPAIWARFELSIRKDQAYIDSFDSVLNSP